MSLPVDSTLDYFGEQEINCNFTVFDVWISQILTCLQPEDLVQTRPRPMDGVNRYISTYDSCSGQKKEYGFVSAGSRFDDENRSRLR